MPWSPVSARDEQGGVGGEAWLGAGAERTCHHAHLDLVKIQKSMKFVRYTFIVLFFQEIYFISDVSSTILHSICGFQA